MKVIVDRFEGELAVVEIDKGRFANIPLCLIPGAVEGDVISIEILKDESVERKKNLDKRLKKLFKD